MQFPIIFYFYLSGFILFWFDIKTGILFLLITASIHFITYVEDQHFKRPGR